MGNRSPVWTLTALLVFGCGRPPEETKALPSDTPTRCREAFGGGPRPLSPLLAFAETSELAPIIEDEDSRNYQDDLGPTHKTGVRFLISAGAELSVQRLEHRVECARTLYASEGARATGYDVDPLALPDTRVRVGTLPGRFVIELRGRGATVDEIERRAARLASR